MKARARIPLSQCPCLLGSLFRAYSFHCSGLQRLRAKLRNASAPICVGVHLHDRRRSLQAGTLMIAVTDRRPPPRVSDRERAWKARARTGGKVRRLRCQLTQTCGRHRGGVRHCQYNWDGVWGPPRGQGGFIYGEVHDVVKTRR